MENQQNMYQWKSENYQQFLHSYLFFSFIRSLLCFYHSLLKFWKLEENIMITICVSNYIEIYSFSVKRLIIYIFPYFRHYWEKMYWTLQNLCIHVYWIWATYSCLFKIKVKTYQTFQWKFDDSDWFKKFHMELP